MKKLIALMATAFLLNLNYAIVPATMEKEPLKAHEIMIPIGKTGQKISLADFSKLSSGEYEKIAHVKLGFFDRIAYKQAMRKLNKGIAADGTITDKKVAELMKPALDGETGFHLGGAALGFLVGLIGVLIAYLINDDKKSNRVKWAWIGFGVLLAILVVASAAASQSTY